MPQIKINADASLVGSDAKIFFDFLTQQNQLQVSFFNKGFSVSFNDHLISFEDNVLSEEISENFTCHFIGQKLGEGNFGTVYDIDKSVIISPIEFIPSGYIQSQVVKMQHHCECRDWESCINHNSLKMLKQEHDATAKAQHLGIHPPVFSQDKLSSYIIMNKLPGVDLFDILENDVQRKPGLTLEQRIELSLALLKAVKEQITALNLIHFDIKPGNIKVDLRTSPMTVKIFDYASAQEIAPGDKGLVTNSQFGTMAYISPEVVWASSDPYFATPAIDLFSLMRILMLIWGGRDNSFGDISMYEREIYLTSPQNLDQLFRELPEYQTVMLRKLGLDGLISACLARGLNRFPERRGTIDEAIMSYQQILDTYKRTLQSEPLLKGSAKACATLGGPLSLKRKHSDDLDEPSSPGNRTSTMVVDDPVFPY